MTPKQFIPGYLKQLEANGADPARVAIIGGFLRDFFHDYAEAEAIRALMIHGRRFTTIWHCQVCGDGGQVHHTADFDPRPSMLHLGCKSPGRIILIEAIDPSDWTRSVRIWPHIYRADLEYVSSDPRQNDVS